FVQKNISLKGWIYFTGGHVIWITLWCVFVTVLHEYFHASWLNIPWLPLSIIGTAVAFYIGFKNNQAYDRLWEARKIWGAIVNSSRAWGSAVKSFVTNQFTDIDLTEEELQHIHKKLLYRHVGWLYALRSQLLIPTQWEHISQGTHMARATKRRMKRFGVGLLDDGVTSYELKCFLPPNEYERLIEYKNTATQIIDQQAQDLKTLRAQKLIDDFRHMELQQILYDFYIHQGKCERIKKFPLPRQYGSTSMMFVIIFILLLPFGMVSEFHKLGQYGAWISIPFSVLVGWVYLVMELVGDYSENPFEGLGNDIPMLSLCRVIEIDLREMLGETETPPGIQAKNGVLM
ncbi:MAG: bestrophin family ion channel, partial [Bacteroidota bacterium]